MKDEVSRSEYEAGITAKKQSAYVVAVTDYLTAPEVVHIDTGSYHGQMHDAIFVTAIDDFMVMGVKVSIVSNKGVVIEEGQADPELSGLNLWRYDAKAVNCEAPGTIIRATAIDKPGNEATLEAVVREQAFNGHAKKSAP